MICYLIYNRFTAAERTVTALAERLEREGVEVELVDADTPRGVQLAENYDLLGRPAVLLVKDDGAPLQSWQGEDQLPSPSDVAYLAHA
jgi:hypothetical protein